MPICPKCGRYHKKSHHRRHVRECVMGVGYPVRHMQVSKGSGSQTKEKQRKMIQAKEERMKKWYGGE